MDILPTLCDYAGIPAPARVTGRSLRPAIRGDGWDRRFVVSELADLGFPDRQGRMLRTDRFKYVAFNGGQRPEQFFELQLNPGEVRNLVGDSEAAKELDRHRELLTGWLSRTRGDFRIPSA